MARRWRRSLGILSHLLSGLLLLPILTIGLVNLDIGIQPDLGENYIGLTSYGEIRRGSTPDEYVLEVSVLPKLDAEGKKIVVGWESVGKNYSAKNNLFKAKVKGIGVDVEVRNDQPDGRKAKSQLSFSPQLYLNGLEILPKSETPTLCGGDPANPNYFRNILEWDYGICKRRLRIIEGRLLGSWVFDKSPCGEVFIRYNQSGSFNLNLSEYADGTDTELVNKGVFDNVSYPFIVGDTLIFYPDAHVETSSVDGAVAQLYAVAGTGVTWATIISDAGNQVYDATTDGYGAYIYGDTVGGNKWRNVWRSIELFDTSSLPDSCNITSAIFSVRGKAKEDSLNILPNINVYSSNPNSATALQGADYSTLGSLALCDTAISYNSFNTSGYNNFALNANGIAVISRTGITKLGTRNANYDAAGVTPPNQANKESKLNIYFSEQGSGFEPKLAITYILIGTASLPLCNNVTNPIAITDTSPVFDARFNHDNATALAQNYEIEVNTKSDFSGTVMWDTGKTAMANVAVGNRGPSPAVTYGGVGLSVNGTGYFWRIRFWDDAGQATPWSDTQHFTMSNTNTLIGWQYRIPIALENQSASNLTNYVCLATINTTALIGAGKMESDCSDTRFTDSDGSTLLSHHLEYGVNTTTTLFRFRIPDLPALTVRTVFLYCGNPGVADTSDSSIYALWDDFSSNTIITPAETAPDHVVTEEANHWKGYPNMVRDSSGKIYCFYDKNTSSGIIGHKIVMKTTNDDGVTWSAESDVMVKVPGTALAGALVFSYSGVEQIIVVGSVGTGTADVEVWETRSPVSAILWSAPAKIADNATATQGQPIMLSNGKILVPYFLLSGASRYGRVAESSDGGGSWTIYNVGTSSEMSEWSMVEIKTGGAYTGGIYGVLRNNFHPARCYFTRSTDYGHTWTEPSEETDIAQSGQGPHCLLRLQNGNIICVQGYERTGTQPPSTLRILESSDECDTWQVKRLAIKYGPIGGGYLADYPSIVQIDETHLLVAWCTNNSDGGDSHVYVQDIPYPFPDSNWVPSNRLGNDYAVSGGMLRIGGASSNESSLYWDEPLSTGVALRVRVNMIADNTWYFGLVKNPSLFRSVFLDLLDDDWGGDRASIAGMATKYQTQTRDSDVEETNNQTSITGWHTIEMGFVSGEVKFWEDGVLMATHTTRVPDEILRPVLRVDATCNDIYYDYLMVRPYVSDEPVTANGDLEENSMLTVVTLAASDVYMIDYPHATLNGQITTMGGVASAYVYWQWGYDTSYGNLAGLQVANATGNYTGELTGFNPDKTIHCRFVGEAWGKYAYGGDQNFKIAETPGFWKISSLVPLAFIIGIIIAFLKGLGRGSGIAIIFALIMVMIFYIVAINFLPTIFDSLETMWGG